MSAVWFVAHAELGRRWRALIALAVMVGIAGGAVLAATAGARRAASSLDRFVESTHPGHVQFSVSGAGATVSTEIADLPQVEVLARFVPMSVLLDADFYVAFGANVDARFGRQLDRPRLLAGRLPDPTHAREVMLPESATKLLHVGVGDRLTVSSFTPEQATAMRASEDALVGDPAGPTVQLRIVGVGRSPADLGVGAEGGVPLLSLTPAFLHRYGDRIGRFDDADFYRVRLLDGGSRSRSFVDAVHRVAGPDALVEFESLSFEAAGVQDSIDALAVGLLIFAAIVGLAGLVAVGQAIGRQVLVAATDDGTHRAMGMRPRQRVGELSVPHVLAGAGGAALAVVIALAASPLMPFGVAGEAEPDRGLDVDGLVLGTGFAVIVAAVSVMTLVAAWRATRRSARAPATRRTWTPRVAPHGWPHE